MIDRRNVLAAGAIAPLLISTSFGATAETYAPTTKSKTFILVHGSWHSSGHWQRLAPLLSAAGHAVIAPDLPGHGLSAKFPTSYFQRPIDLSKFSTEVSPVGAVTLDQYVASVTDCISFATKAGWGPIILVGHSMGGVTTTAVVEQNAKQIHHVVYLAAFMPKDGASALSYLSAPENATAAVSPLLLGDPTKTGCVRIDMRSADPSYVAALQNAFYNDVDLPTFQAAANLLTPDDPIGAFAAATHRTIKNWGSVPRSYIRTLKDHALPVALQNRFISESDSFAFRNPTKVYDIDSSHSPFLSQPKALADILLAVARAKGDEAIPPWAR
ncbi:pimeloyl-ACP methyl ester carboxylesterase [Bradyrhizobium sp. USDA 4463]